MPSSCNGFASLSLCLCAVSTSFLETNSSCFFLYNFGFFPMLFSVKRGELSSILLNLPMGAVSSGTTSELSTLNDFLPNPRFFTSWLEKRVLSEISVFSDF